MFTGDFWEIVTLILFAACILLVMKMADDEIRRRNDKE
jgi:hypothetical protein